MAITHGMYILLRDETCMNLQEINGECLVLNNLQPEEFDAYVKKKSMYI